MTCPLPFLQRNMQSRVQGKSRYTRTIKNGMYSPSLKGRTENENKIEDLGSDAEPDRMNGTELNVDDIRMAS